MTINPGNIEEGNSCVFLIFFILK